MTGWDQEALQLLQTSVKGIAVTRHLAIVNAADPFGDHSRVNGNAAPVDESREPELSLVGELNNDHDGSRQNV